MKAWLLVQLEKFIIYLHYEGKIDLYTVTSKHNKKRAKKRRVPLEIKWRVWERDNFTCLYCGTRRFLTLDHKVPVCKSGSNDEDNLLTACQGCNNKKGDESYERFIRSKWLRKKRKGIRRSLIMSKRDMKTKIPYAGPIPISRTTGRIFTDSITRDQRPGVLKSKPCSPPL